MFTILQSKTTGIFRGDLVFLGIVLAQLTVNLLLHPLVLLILQSSELNHLHDVLFEIIDLQLQSVTM